VSELIASSPEADVEYVEEFLLQVMNDEFDVNVEDGSGEEVAAKIVGLRKLTLHGDFTMVEEMYRQWQERQSKGASKVNFQCVDRGEDDDDTDWDSDDSEEEEDEDVKMDEAPALVKTPKERVQPKIDEDGFTEVVSKRKR